MSSALMTHGRYLWLIAASLIAGIMNALAGGGSFISFPAMLGVGVPPIEANATNTVALWPGQLTSLATLRGDVRRSLLPTVLAASLLGGVAGAETLIHTRQLTFLHLIPWLLLAGSLIFGVSGSISRWLRTRSAHAHDPLFPLPHEHKINPIYLLLGLFPVCFYVGFFGAGAGFLVMTVLALFGMEDMHQLNAMKIVAASASNLCAIITFVLSRRVIWHYCLAAMLAAGVGGYIGARYARRMNPDILRVVVVITGVVIAGYFFWRQH